MATCMLDLLCNVLPGAVYSNTFGPRAYKYTHPVPFLRHIHTTPTVQKKYNE